MMFGSTSLERMFFQLITGVILTKNTLLAYKNKYKICKATQRRGDLKVQITIYFDKSSVFNFSSLALQEELETCYDVVHHLSIRGINEIMFNQEVIDLEKGI